MQCVPGGFASPPWQQGKVPSTRKLLVQQPSLPTVGFCSCAWIACRGRSSCISCQASAARKRSERSTRVPKPRIEASDEPMPEGLIHTAPPRPSPSPTQGNGQAQQARRGTTPLLKQHVPAGSRVATPGPAQRRASLPSAPLKAHQDNSHHKEHPSASSSAGQWTEAWMDTSSEGSRVAMRGSASSAGHENHQRTAAGLYSTNTTLQTHTRSSRAEHAPLHATTAGGTAPTSDVQEQQREDTSQSRRPRAGHDDPRLTSRRQRRPHSGSTNNARMPLPPAAASQQQQPREHPTSPKAPGSLDCSHFSRCSGCSLDTCLPTPPQYLEARQFFTSTLGLQEFPMVAGPLAGWRCRAKLAVRGKPGAPLIGLFKRGSHDVEPIVPGCSAHHPSINACAELIHTTTAALGIAPFNESTGEGYLRYLQLTVVERDADSTHPAPPAADSSQGLSASQPGPLQQSSDQARDVKLEGSHQDPGVPCQVVLVWRANSPDCPSVQEARRLAAALWQIAGPTAGGAGRGKAEAQQQLSRKGMAGRGTSMEAGSNAGQSLRMTVANSHSRSSQPLVHSIWLNFQPATGTQPGANAILGGSWLLLHGPSTAWQSWWRSTPVALAPGSFVQANYGAFHSALTLMAAAVPATATRLVDMHAGVGAIGLSLLGGLQPQIQHLRCVEINPEGQSPFLQSAARMRDRWQRKLASTAGARAAPELDYVVAAAGSAAHKFLEGADVVVVDPPRKGLEPSLLEALAACDWERSSPSPAHPPRPLRRLLYLSCGYPALVTDASVLLGKAPPATRQQLRQRVPPQRESQVAAEHSAVDAVISRPPRWRLISATALLFFPGTDSIETLCVFEELPPA